MKMSSVDKLSMGSIIVQSPGNIVSDMDGATVMLSIDNGKYYNLGVIGGYIWRIIKTPISIDKLISKLTCEFDVENGVCEKEVIPFLDQLLQEKIIMIEKVL
jgi:hypothetical protein